MRVLAEVLAHPHPLMPPSSVIDTPHATQRAKASATRTRARVPPQARPKSHIHNVHTSKSATSLCDPRWIKVATPPLAWVESSFHTCLLVHHDVNIAEYSFCAFPRGIGGSCTSARDSPSRPSVECSARLGKGVKFSFWRCFWWVCKSLVGVQELSLTPWWVSEI